MKIRSAVIAILLSAVLAPTLAARQIDNEEGGFPDRPDGGGTSDPSDPIPDPSCPQHATATIIASPSTIALGQSAEVIWSATLPPEHCDGAWVSVNGQARGTEGSMTVKPMSSRPYGLTVNGVQLATAVLTVTLPGTIKIKDSTREWKDLLVQALGTPHTRVILADTVNMDLSGYSGIFISNGVTFTSEAPKLASQGFGPDDVLYRGPARDARHLGPRIYTTNRVHPLFEIKCFAQHGENGAGDNVRINSFRLHGPDVAAASGSDHKDRGIMVNGCKGIEIANMEVAGWSGQAIYVQDLADADRITKPDDVRIQDSFFHHNQQKTGGEGYGVEVKSGAYALIERNVFDFNRHAIMAGGEDGTGYTARLNLVLKGGGVHSWDSHGIISWYTHQFDVHGTDSSHGYDACCGQAGEHFEFIQNVFQYTNGNAIKVRGSPTDSALVAGNVFAHGSRGDAIVQNGNAGPGDNITNPIQVTGSNVFGADTYGRYGVCDIDGDGKDDLFLATGVSWWYASAGRMHWTHLKEATERLDQVGLGDFDGDGRCDVFVVNRSGKEWKISPGGSGAWTVLKGTYDFPFDELAFGDFNGDGITDVFRRDTEGQWWAISPGIYGKPLQSSYGWKPLQSSSFPRRELYFGHFDNDRITDVITAQGGHWLVSWGGIGTWEPLNNALGDSLKGVLIGDIDHNGVDDILRYRLISTQLPNDNNVRSERGVWGVSWDGRSKWTEIKALAWPSAFADPLRAARVRGFVGRFRGAGADLLSVDYTRAGSVYNPVGNSFSRHSLYAY